MKKDIQSLSFIEGNFIDAPLHIKLSLRRKLLGLITTHLLFVLFVTSILKFTPLARFYINENEWIFQIACISLVLVHILLLWKRNEYKINIFLLFMHMLLQALAFAVFVTYYDTLGVLQGIFLSFSALNLIFVYLVFFGKTCSLLITLSFCLVILFIIALLFQIIFGCTFEELFTSVIFSLCLSFYYLYSVNLTAHSVSYEKFCVAVINVYTWPFITITAKLESLVKG
ncbi:hypothetical protein JTE90_028813 [Oedothorax gibbosus]|uniref:Uncharacterized protein n=1 Tax=Oedothorax gibbosus TaxID=931172 RepID=A0AAV6VZT5_9ARAC|nr:hypothetical protein JTE90_028813 [Oedothorax gibbosus]